MAIRGRLYSFMIGDELRGELRAVASSYGMPEAALIRRVLSGWLRLSAQDKQRIIEGATVKERRATMSFAVKRSREVEDKQGVGVLRIEGKDTRRPVRYGLHVDVEQVRAGDQWLDGLLEIEAVVQDLDESAEWDLFQGEAALVLEMEDGRHFACSYAGNGRLVARTGHALYRPDGS